MTNYMNYPPQGPDTSKLPKKLGSVAAVQLALLITGSLCSVSVQAGYNIPTQTVNPDPLIPTIPVPSPLCGVPLSATGATTTNADGSWNVNCPVDSRVEPFTTKLLQFEEFGTKPLDQGKIDNSAVFPAPATCDQGPDGHALDAFLAKDINSVPVETVDESIPNPWQAQIQKCPTLEGVTKSVAEGRPPGPDFKHQRWGDFPTKRYFQSAITGARTNGGLRNAAQMHGYAHGEYAPGGLNYITGTDGKAGTTGIQVKIHPNLPVQDKNSVWTFDGTLSPKLLMAKYGEVLNFRNYDALPIDVAANNGFGRHTITTHEHNGHNPAESDGFAHAFFFPGQYYDYHWPMVLAGYDSINTTATDPRAGAPDGNGGITNVPGDWRATMSTHWFHDHMEDYTASNVYKGNAAAMNYYSALDRGREPATIAERDNLPASVDATAKPGYACHYANPANVNLCLPSGTGLDWGNRDYDVNLVVADKAWDPNGQLKFNIFNMDGFLGDRITVNWQYKPTLDVRPRRYRFRILDGSVSRNFKMALVKQVGTSYVKVPFHMIANDGNLMEHAIPFPNPQSKEALPEMAIGERYDIIIDFAGMPEDTKLYLVNIMDHENGRGPKNIISLANVLGAPVDGVAPQAVYVADGVNGDPGVGKLLEFKVAGPATANNQAVSATNPALVDYSMNPAEYEETVKKTTIVNGLPVTTIGPGKQMIPLDKPTAAELANAVHRTFEFGRSNGTDIAPWTIKTDNGVASPAVITTVSAAPVQGAVEIWHIQGGNGWNHPVHVHFEEGQILKRGDVPPPIWEKYARKDIYRVGPTPDSTTSVDVAIRFRDFAGTYVEHCHNTMHEDHAMLLRWDLEHPGQTLPIQTPEPEWTGVLYDPSIYGATAKTGDTKAKQNFVLPVTAAINGAAGINGATGINAAAGINGAAGINAAAPAIKRVNSGRKDVIAVIVATKGSNKKPK